MAQILIIAVVAAIVGIILFLKRQKPDRSPEISNQVSVSPNVEINIIPANKDSTTDTAKQDIKETEESNDATDDEYNDSYWIQVESNRRKVNASIKLKYRKTNNQITERTFDVESFSRGKEGYHVHGYCHRKKKHIT